jgi:glycosyltransferase involved in cell wall biosynthesis
MPKVSICIPAFKQTGYLSKLLDSILIQEYKDYEVIVTDDSIYDTVENLINQYDFKGRLKYIRNKERKGTPANWNEAISFASGEYIKLVHHDDWFANSNSLQKFVDLLDNNPDADFAFSGCFNVGESNAEQYFIKPVNLVDIKKSPYNLILGNYIGAPSVTIYRRLAHKEFDVKLKWLVDLDQYIRMLNKNQNFINTNEPLINICNKGIHQVTNACENNRDVELSEYTYIYKKYNGLFRLDKKHYRLLYNLYVKYNIRNINDLESINLISDIPNSIKTSFRLFKLRLVVKSLIINCKKLLHKY